MTPQARHAKALEASRNLPAAKAAAGQAWQRRASEEAKLDDRQRLVDHLTGASIGTWLPRLTGRLGDRQAPATAALREQEVTTIRAVRNQEASVKRLAEIQAAADDLPAAREAAVEVLAEPDAHEARLALDEARELAEAIFAANRAHLAASGVDEELARAKSLSTYDTYFGGGMIASMMKHDAIDDANSKSAPLTECLLVLRKELQDLGAPTSYFAVQAHDLTATADVWFDNVFSDLAIARRITDARDRTQRLQSSLTQLATSLGEKRLVALARVDAIIGVGWDGR